MKILLVDDDRDLVDLLRYALQRDGYTVVTALDGQAGLRVFNSEAPDLVVLDLMMPKMTGEEVLKEIRTYSEVPVLVLTAVGDEDRAVQLLRIGADDYLIKPVRMREFKARVAAFVRRWREWSKQATGVGEPLVSGEISINPQCREVLVNGGPVKLSSTEFSVLHYLMLNRNIALSASNLISNVWGYESESTEDVVKVTISRLRRKIEPDPSAPRYVVTVPGAGYLFQHKK